MRSFDIVQHVMDHAAFVIDGLSNKEEVKHFNTSVDISYLIQNGYSSLEEIDEVMKKMIQTINEIVLISEEINGSYIKKNGEISVYRVSRETRFNRMLLAYHNSHADATKIVHPHIHIVHLENARLGLYYSYLKKILRKVAEKYKIKFNFMEMPRNTGLSTFKQKALDTMGWVFNQNIKDEIINYIQDGRLLKCLVDLEIHYEVSENISYYIKTLNIVNQRLYEMDIDFEYKGANLKESIPLSLLKTHDQLLYTLQVGLEVSLDMQNVIDREILKYFNGFDTEVMKILADVYKLDSVSKKLIKMSKDFGDNKHNEEDTIVTPTFHECINKDIFKAVDHAVNLTTFKRNLQRLGYQETSIKYTKSTKKGYPSGIRMKTPMNSKLDIQFASIGFGWKIMKQTFEQNKKRKNLSMDNVSHLEEYVPKEVPKIVSKKKVDFVYKVMRRLLIFNHSNTNLNYHNALAHEYDVIRSEMYDITSLTNKNGVVIVDYGTHLELKQDRGKREGIDAILEIAKLKGWEASSLQFRGDHSYTILSEMLATRVLSSNKQISMPNKSDKPLK